MNANNMRIERQGLRAEPYTVRLPEVRGGVCEFCGTIDPNVPSQHQYKLCPHYRGTYLRCSYCPADKDVEDVTRRSRLNVHAHPNDPNTAVVVCDSFECSDKHLKRFQLTA